MLKNIKNNFQKNTQTCIGAVIALAGVGVAVFIKDYATGIALIGIGATWIGIAAPDRKNN